MTLVSRLFKTPMHIGYINQIIRIYPDAHIVWVYRDAAQVGLRCFVRGPLAMVGHGINCCDVQSLASFCNMLRATQQLTRRLTAEYLKQCGPTVMRLFQVWAEAGVEQYEALQPSVQQRVLFVRYSDLVADPVAQACRVVAVAHGRPCSEEDRRALETFQRTKNSQRRPGRKSSRYDLGDFGTTPDDVNRALAWYSKWFNDRWQEQSSGTPLQARAPPHAIDAMGGGKCPFGHGG